MTGASTFVLASALAIALLLSLATVAVLVRALRRSRAMATKAIDRVVQDAFAL